MSNVATASPAITRPDTQAVTTRPRRLVTERPSTEPSPASASCQEALATKAATTKTTPSSQPSVRSGLPMTTAAKYTTVVGFTAVRARKAANACQGRRSRDDAGAAALRPLLRRPIQTVRTAIPRRTSADAPCNQSAYGSSLVAIAAPPTTATAAYMPSTVATPRAAADPVRIEVRAVRATSSAPTAPIGMAMAQPVTRPASTTSSTVGLWWERSPGASGMVGGSTGRGPAGGRVGP